VSKPVVYLICGVPGSGKTWVASQLAERFAYVPHDDHIGGDLAAELAARARDGDGPFVTECPFGERELREQLEAEGFKVRPYFIVEPTEVVQARYKKRTGKELPKGAVTRTKTINKRVAEWNVPSGTAAEVLAMLKDEGRAA
jgi:tRNA A37 N6-isopentenylltransferase MiaA